MQPNREHDDDISVAGQVPAAVLLQRARDLHREGEIDVARELVRAAYAAPDAGDHLRASAGHLLCRLHYLQGDFAALADFGRGVQATLGEQQRDDERFELRVWLTVGCCELARFEDALEWAAQNWRDADGRGDAPRRVVVLNAMGACFDRMGDPWQAERLMSDALALATRHRLDTESVVTLNNLSATLIGMSQLQRDGASAEEARATLLRALSHAERAREMTCNNDDPYLRTVVEGNLAEALLYLERPTEALTLLVPAVERARAIGFVAQSWRLACTLGETHLALGDFDNACAELEAVQAEIEDHGPRATLLRVHRALYRALRALGENGPALAHHEAWHHLERQRVTQQLIAQSRHLARKLTLARAGERDEPRGRRDAAPALEGHRDPLTGLPNRRGMEQRVRALAERAGEQAFDLAVAVIDAEPLSGAPAENPAAAASDMALVPLAQLLRERTRPGDLLARVDGGQFTLVVTDIAPADARRVAERLRDSVLERASKGSGFTATLNVGIANARIGPDTPPALRGLFRQAGAALTRAKREGRAGIADATDASTG